MNKSLPEESLFIVLIDETECLGPLFSAEFISLVELIVK